MSKNQNTREKELKLNSIKSLNLMKDLRNFNEIFTIIECIG